jgi:CSLREA domain-containing protein
MKSHKTFRFRRLPVLLIPALIVGLIPARASAATLVVTNTIDPGVGGCTASGNGDGCTLREAITAANNQTLTPGADTINASGISGIITLLTALPALSTGITLNGPGATNLTVQRNSAVGTPNFRVFTIDNTTTTGPTVVLAGLTISGGKVSGSNALTNSGGGIYNNHGILTVRNSVLKSNSATNGGAICNNGSLSKNATLTLSNSTITNIIATGGGGGLFNNGSGGGSAPLAISNSTFASNRATNGGAILNDGHTGGSATITELSNSVINANIASGNGGGIENNGSAGGSATLVISYTNLSANTASSGGGIDNNGVGGSATQAVLYSTFNANKASVNGGAINNDGRSAGSATVKVGTSTFNANTATAKGGAVLNNGTGGSATVEIDNSTLKGNTASVNSAAIDSDGTAGSATLALGSTILANGPSKNLTLTVNSETTFTSKNHNLSSDAAGGNGTTAPGGPYLAAGGDIRNTDPKLDTLKSNGGPTQTLALLLGSPAIDRGISSLTTDQRGFVRPVDSLSVANAAGGDGSDIGAFEVQAAPAIAPKVSINDASITEGNSATKNLTFTVTLSAASGQNVTVQYTTANSTAVAGSDYITTSGTLTIAAGQASGAIRVPIVGDTIAESNDALFLNLTNPTNATITDAQGIGTIINDDAGPGLSINDVTMPERDSGSFNATFTVTLSAPSNQTVTVNAIVYNGTAVSPSDYTTGGTRLTFAPGQTSQTVNVPVNGDLMNENDETFYVILSSAFNATLSRGRGIGTILNDDSVPALLVNDVQITEGNSGTKILTFTITLSKASGKTVSVNYATANGVALSTSDYMAASGTMNFTSGQASKTVNIVIRGDVVIEGNETLFVLLSSAVNASIGRARGVGTIINDDSSG